ncbi:MAG: CMD domain protein [Alphaproteobacteria bacterium]|nr:CMD domain protein [Alphaproteobacteria bacterium]
MLPPDVLDTLAGIAPGSPLDLLRRRKPVTRENAQASFLALFAPADPGGVSVLERAAVAAFVAGIHDDPAARDFYGAMLSAAGAPAPLGAAIVREVAGAAGSGPYGSFPAGPLSREDAPGRLFSVAPGSRAILGDRIAAALDHAHMLVFHPRDATPAALRKLEAAGWSATDIVTLSQLVSFLCFQLRAACGLRALGASLRSPS